MDPSLDPNGAVALLPDRLQGGLWLGFFDGGIAYLKDGQVRAFYDAAHGLGKGSVSDLQLGSDGAVWAATEGGLSRVKGGLVSTLTSQNGLPCDAMNWVIEDNDHSFWLYMSCGLVRIARSELEAWVSDPKRSVQTTVFDSSDGVRSRALPGPYGRKVTKSLDGKIWFSPPDGVSVIDPRHLPFNKLPPPVHIEQITVDRKTYLQNLSGDASSSPPRLPPLVRDLKIDYTALSLVVPEKVHFRFKLEGQDRDWREVVNDRQVQYSNLGPGDYRFRVTACNNSGVWNEVGTLLDFSIAPAHYQTTWFRLSCAAAFLALLWALYRLRVRQLAYQFNITLEARVNERTRIARDLHDTLLQSFHGLMLRFQTVSNLLPAGKAKQTLDSAIDQAAQAITESRDAIQGLRSSTVETTDLALAVRTLGEEIAAAQTDQNSAILHVGVEGAPRDLHPILRDEVYRIAGEALRNAFEHAQARKIEVEIRYDERQLRLRVRDDGRGIDPKALVGDGRTGHYGLRGMRERAKLLGGKLTVWSELDSGTEVELSIPASHAYATSPAPHRSWFAEKFSGKDTEMKS
jgi:signal transduction histidine kinase